MAALVILLLTLINLDKMNNESVTELKIHILTNKNNQGNSMQDFNVIDADLLYKVYEVYGNLKNIKEENPIRLNVNESRKTDKQFAMKYFLNEDDFDEADLDEAEKMMKQEAYVLNMKEDIIPKIYRHGKTTDKNIPFIIMESLNYDFLSYIDDEKNNLLMEEKIGAYIKIVEMYRKLHEIGIVHCNVKLENIAFISESFNFKLLNFHLSTFKKICDSENINNIAPEVIRKEKVSGDDVFKSDIYMLGVMLYNLEKKLNPEIVEANQKQDSHENKNLVYKNMSTFIFNVYTDFKDKYSSLNLFERYENLIDLAFKIVILSTLKEKASERPSAENLKKEFSDLEEDYNHINAFSVKYKNDNSKDTIDFQNFLHYGADKEVILSTFKLVSVFVKQFDNKDSGSDKIII